MGLGPQLSLNKGMRLRRSQQEWCEGSGRLGGKPGECEVCRLPEKKQVSEE